MKLAPWLTAPGELAGRLLDAGADGLVLFNRFMQPDIDVRAPPVVSRPELSTPWEARLPMTWIALLRGRTDRSLPPPPAWPGPLDVAQLPAGGRRRGDERLRAAPHGPAFAATLVEGLRDWLREQAAPGRRASAGPAARSSAGDSRAKRGAYIDYLAAGRASSAT